MEQWIKDIYTFVLKFKVPASKMIVDNNHAVPRSAFTPTARKDKTTLFKFIATKRVKR